MPTLLAGSQVHIFLEKPLTKLIRRRFRRIPFLVCNPSDSSILIVGTKMPKHASQFMNQTIWSLQALRACAALLVVLAHIKFPIEKLYGVVDLPEVLRGAGLACGVDSFFVLSGFVISMTATRHQPEAGGFLKHRVIRILPLYLILSLPYFWEVVRGGFAGGDIPFRQLWNSVMMVPILDKFAINDPVHPFGWTLSFEMWFYTLFAILLLVVPAKRIPWVMIGLFAITAPLPFFWDMDWKFPYFAFHPLCWEFAFGCLAFKLTGRFKPGVSLACAVLIGSSAVLITNVQIFEWLGWHGRVRMVPEDSALRALLWGLPSMGIVMAAVWLEPWIIRFSGLKPLYFLGAASYSIYLIQPLVFRLMGHAGELSGRMAWPLFAALIVVATLLAGSLVHIFLEKPLTNSLSRRFRRDAVRSVQPI